MWDDRSSPADTPADDRGADTRSIDAGDDTRSIDAGADARSIDAGDDTRSIDAGDDTRSIESRDEGRSIEPGVRTDRAAYEIDPEYDSQYCYGHEESFYGRGRYPPDWDARREAVWDRQAGRCGRCGDRVGDDGEVHHVVHLSDGGSNELDNLVGLCVDCHALMHPGQNRMRGSIRSASVFPDREAEPQVATIRVPEDEAVWTDVSRLVSMSDPDVNRRAMTPVIAPTSADVARRAADDMEALLIEAGYVPRSAPHHLIRVRPRVSGVIGIFSRYRPSIGVDADGSAAEVGSWEGDNDACDVFVTSDARRATITIEDGGDRPIRRTVWFDADDADRTRADVSDADRPKSGVSDGDRTRADISDGDRTELDVPVRPPRLSLRTAPEYGYDAFRYFVLLPVLWGVLPVGLAELIAADVTPWTTWPGLLAAIVLVGLLLRLPRLATDVRSAIRARGRRSIR